MYPPSLFTQLVLTMYPCTECPFVGTQNNALKKHISMNHKPDIFPCKLCPYVSTAKTNTNLHVKRMHDVYTQGEEFPMQVL